MPRYHLGSRTPHGMRLYVFGENAKHSRYNARYAAQLFTVRLTGCIRLCTFPAPLTDRLLSLGRYIPT